MTAYQIGMDFGTTNSTIAYVEDGKPIAFKFPPPDGAEYIPTCVAYSEDGAHPGREAQRLIEDEEVEFLDRLKMFLPMSDEERKSHGWTGDRSPEDAIADYFQLLLTDADGDSPAFAVQRGPLAKLVVSVPHVWDSMDHPGRERLQRIISERLNLPLEQLVSEPVAAAACFAWQRGRQNGGSFTGNLLICDMGGGTFDVTLCHVAPGKITAIHNDGNGRRRMGRAGVYFDRELIRAGFKKKNAEFEDNGPVFRVHYHRMQEYKTDSHRTIRKNLELVAKDPDSRDQTILRASAMKFSFEDIETAFSPVEKGIRDVMGRVKEHMDRKDLTVDAVYFVGGFCQFLPVQETIKSCLDVPDDRYVTDANRENPRFAIAYGAALIANGMFEVEETFDHTLGIIGNLYCPGKDGLHRIKEERLPIITGGKKLHEYASVQYADCDVRLDNETPRITLFVERAGDDRPVARDLPPELDIRIPGAGKPGREKWKAGMCVNRSKVVYLVFRNAEGGDTVEFELGDIIRKIFDRPEIMKREDS